MEKIGYIGYCGDHTALVRTEPGFMMYCDTLDVGITPHLMNKGRWQPHLTRFITSLDLKGKVCIDVGANIGFYTCLFGHKKAAQIYSFEPIPRLCNMIKKSISFNGKNNSDIDFYIHQLGLSNYQGEVMFKTHAGNLGGSRVVGDADKATGSITVRSLDSFDIDQIDFMKIDVEGLEGEVLLGASKTIKLSPDPLIVMEWNPTYADPKLLSDIWDKLDLKAYVLARNGSLENCNPYSITTSEEIVLKR